ncbi:hypothetical protein [Erythrobacter crassostreae]|uniref:DUF4893 domain-containing protein n=1 Tax=Erythrobacter crassostreae TaxID=2828328 RepID=A0A9X1F307_9SPHN|nr:hypothetical protein [Erythrobacter crassostrea]MBV7259229.1 hypothetical protein [Erythrobacter crassostrea]
MIGRFITACALALTLPVSALAKDDTSFAQLRKEEAVTVNPEKAYFLFRVPDAANSIFFLRVPSKADLAAYETAKRAEYDRKKRKMPYEEFVFDWEEVPNLFEVRPKRKYVEIGDKLRVQIVEAPAGEYVVYGVGYNGYMYQCNCMGTVGFVAEPGKVTDLGTYLVSNAWDPSPHPELKDESGLGRVARMDFGMFAFGIRPVEGEAFVPAQLAGSEIVPAPYRAIGPWVDRRRIHANRLAAIPGVLEYREGIPFDPVTGDELRLSLHN